MYLLQASYLYAYSLLTGVTFPIHPLSSYALNPNDVATVGNILELLLWNIFQCYRHFFLMFSIS